MKVSIEIVMKKWASIKSGKVVVMSDAEFDELDFYINNLMESDSDYKLYGHVKSVINNDQHGVNDRYLVSLAI